MMDWLAKTYVNALNVIHYMHDKYCYEAIEMALHDRDILRTLACGIAGLSHAADSLSAIKYAKVKPVRDERGTHRRLRDRGRIPVLRQQRRPRRRPRQAAGIDDDEQDPDVSDLSRRRPHAVGADHHLQRRLRKEYGQHAGRPQEGRGLRARGEPVERPGHARRPRGADVGRQDPVRRCRGRHLADAVGGARRARQRSRPRRARMRARSTRISRAAASTSTSMCSIAKRCRTR